VNPNKPLILSLHGQSHGELSQVLVKKSAELPYLAQRLICHVDCNSLTPSAKRLLFVTNREDARRGIVLNMIQQEIVKALKSDDELTRLNNEAKEQGIRERDETAVQEMRKEIARLLRIQGLDVTEDVGGEAAQNGASLDRPVRSGRRHASAQPIPLREPPSFIRIQWPQGEEVTFHPEQRRYIRIETDANSNYHNPDDPAASRINIVRPDLGVVFCGSTSLQAGRMRAIYEGTHDANVGDRGLLRVELIRPGLPVLSDERAFRIVAKPAVRPAGRQVTLPLFKWRPVEGPDDDLWNTLGWPENVSRVASTATMEQSCLVICYSTVFPRFARQREFLERKNPALAASFTKRYEIWLAVHSLLLHQDQQAAEASGSAGMQRIHAEEDLEQAEARDRQERCRIGAMAALFAGREVETPSLEAAEVE
jgi:hypothetical protein